MLDTPNDRYYDAVAEERRKKHIAEILGDDILGDPTEEVRREPAVSLFRRGRVLTGAAMLSAIVAAWWLLGGWPAVPAAAAPPAVTVALPLQEETALEETETSLSNFARSLERHRIQVSAFAFAERAARIVRAQTREGVINSLETLDAERTLVEGRAALADQDADVSCRQIAVFKSFGSGWSGVAEATVP